MAEESLTLPLYVIVNHKHRDAKTRTIAVSGEMSLPWATIGETKCLPLFTSITSGREFMDNTPPLGIRTYLSRLNAKQLCEFLEAVKPPGIVVDPTSNLPDSTHDILDTGIITAWVRGQVR